jgi:hypothetical protein
MWISHGGGLYEGCNYPDGDSVKSGSFECYYCRTGIVPQDSGTRKRNAFDAFFIFIGIWIIVMIVLYIVANFGTNIGLSQSVVEKTKFFCIPSFVILIAELVLFFVYVQMRIRPKSKDKE